MSCRPTCFHWYWGWHYRCWPSEELIPAAATQQDWRPPATETQATAQLEICLVRRHPHPAQSNRCFFPAASAVDVDDDDERLDDYDGDDVAVDRSWDVAAEESLLRAWRSSPPHPAQSVLRRRRRRRRPAAKSSRRRRPRRRRTLLRRRRRWTPAANCRQTWRRPRVPKRGRPSAPVWTDPDKVEACQWQGWSDAMLSVVADAAADDGDMPINGNRRVWWQRWRWRGMRERSTDWARWWTTTELHKQIHQFRKSINQFFKFLYQSTHVMYACLIVNCVFPVSYVLQFVLFLV